jgi:uncharacterized membrane protein YidH (DUF202 family)
MTRRAVDRPGGVFDPGLQHERTTLAWERTAIAGMVGGTLLARYAAVELDPVWASVGIGVVVLGAVLLVWAGRHYDDLHGPLRRGENPAHPAAVRLVGLATIAFTAVALLLALAIAF